MNPGYQGRAELPTAFRNVLRPITFYSISHEVICEDYFVSCGFQASRELNRTLIKFI